MTNADFNRWLENYCTAFPDVGEWLNRVPQQASTLALWKQSLDDQGVDGRALIEATRRILRGELDAVTNYERERTPAIVGGYARRVAWERHQAVAVSPNIRHAVKCLDCLDTGLITCLEIDSRYLRLYFTEQAARPVTCSAACACSAGDRWCHSRSQRPLPRYDPHEHPRVRNELDRAAVLAEFQRVRLAKLEERRRRDLDQWNET